MPRPETGPIRLLLALALLPFAGCGDDSPVSIPGPEDVTFAPATGVVLSLMTRLETGVYTQTIVEGEGGDLVPGTQAVFDYTLYLPDGTVVETASGFTYTHDVTPVIPGFRDGVHRMLEGATRLIVIPADQAYGRNPPPGIPVNSVLVFRIALVSLAG